MPPWKTCADGAFVDAGTKALYTETVSVIREQILRSILRIESPAVLTFGGIWASHALRDWPESPWTVN